MDPRNQGEGEVPNRAGSPDARKTLDPGAASGSRKTREPQAVADVLGGVMAAMGLDLAAPAAAIGDNWEEIVGREIAEHCRPIGVRAGVLHADVDSSVWCQQLHLRTPVILAALKDFLGSAAPTDLRFRVGHIGYSRQPRPDESGTGRIE